MLKFTKEPLERLIFVFQTGGNNIKIKGVVSGLESFIYGAIMFGKLPLTKKGICYVFGEKDEDYRGFIKFNKDGMPEKYVEDEKSFFKDFYTITYKEYISVAD